MNSQGNTPRKRAVSARERDCAECGSRFTARPDTTKYCGDGCRRRSRNRYHRALCARQRGTESARHAAWVDVNREHVNAYLADLRRLQRVIEQAKEYPAFTRAGFLVVRTRPDVRGTFYRAAPLDAVILPTEQALARYERDRGRWIVRAPPCAPGHLRAIAERLAARERQAGTDKGR